MRVDAESYSLTALSVEAAAVTARLGNSLHYRPTLANGKHIPYDIASTEVGLFTISLANTIASSVAKKASLQQPAGKLTIQCTPQIFRERWPILERLVSGRRHMKDK